MNAYELADKLDWHWDNDCRSPAISQAADMLRQQADRIAELEKEADRLSNHADELRKIHANRIMELESKL